MKEVSLLHAPRKVNIEEKPIKTIGLNEITLETKENPAAEKQKLINLRSKNSSMIDTLKGENQFLKAHCNSLHDEFEIVKVQKLSLTENKKNNVDGATAKIPEEILAKEVKLQTDINELQHRIAENDKEINKLMNENAEISEKLGLYVMLPETRKPAFQFQSEKVYFYINNIFIVNIRIKIMKNIDHNQKLIVILADAVDFTVMALKNVAII